MFGDRYLYAGLGTTLDVGANPRVTSDGRSTNAADDRDLRSYRTLLARSDEQASRPASRSASPANDAAATVNARRSPAQ
jgi:hypothetical protein